MYASLADRNNQQLVDRLIAEGSLCDPPVIAAFRATPRHPFLERVYRYVRKIGRWREVRARELSPACLKLIYSDRALITGLGRAAPDEPLVPISSSSQPSLMAQMLQDLRLRPGLRVLEVGAGTGYNAALLAHLVGPDRVTSIDVDREVLAEAEEHLAAFADRRVRLEHADGRSGFAAAAPYDRILVTAASRDLEPAWLGQLGDGGLVQVPLALAPGLEFLAQGTVRDGGFDGRLTRAAYFMPLRAEDDTGPAGAKPLVVPPAPRVLPAPWAGWFDRTRLRLSWLGFSQSLAFLGLLRGLEVHYRALESGDVGYGVSAAERRDWCWFGRQEWQVSDEAGRDLGAGLWRAFLEAGGPWPTEYRLLARPDGDFPPADRPGYCRRGPLCVQRWELAELRERPCWL